MITGGGNENKISEVNSRSTLLTSGAVFTGKAENVSAYDSVILAVKTDQNGTYSAQFSTDGENWDSVLTRYYRTTQIEVPHRFTITRKFFRLVFTNTSSSDQTYLRLETVFGNKSQLNSPMDSVLAQDFDSVVTRPTDFRYEVALGRRQGATTWTLFGYNSDVDIGTEILGAQGGAFTFLTAASTLTIVSSSTDDDGSPAGIGANSILIYGVDANRQSRIEIVTLNGTTNVVTSTTWLGVNRVALYLAGSTFSNVGNITITATTGGTVQAYVPATKSNSQQLIFFTQADHTFLLDWLVLDAERLVGGGANPRVQFRMFVWSALTNARYEVAYSVLDLAIESDHVQNPSQPLIIGEKSVIWVEATTDVNNTVVSGRFSGIEFRDVDA